MKREIKFRAWLEGKHGSLTFALTRMDYDVTISPKGNWCDVESGWDIHGEYDTVPVMQFTGLHDKSGNNTCIYEGDIVSLDGILIGNRYENEYLLKDAANLLIEGFGTKTWTKTEQAGLERGLHYSE